MSFKKPQIYPGASGNKWAWHAKKFKQVFLKSVIVKHAQFVEKQVRGRKCSWSAHDIKKTLMKSTIIWEELEIKVNISCSRAVCVSPIKKHIIIRFIRRNKAHYTRDDIKANINIGNIFGMKLKRPILQKSQNKPIWNIKSYSELSSD